MAQRLRLSLEEDGRTVASVTRDSRSHKLVRLGTLPTTDLPLADAKACRLHAFIELDAAGATLIDLGTLTGTELNGVRTRRAALHDGDTIGIGATTIRVCLAPILETPLPLPEAERAVALPATLGPPSALADLPVPAPAPAAPHDATVRVQRGVGRDWRARDYVRRETYDTRALVAGLRRASRRGRAAASAAVLAVLALLAAPAGWRLVDRAADAPEPAPLAVSLPPAPPAEPPAAAPVYEVRPGDTLGRIARRELGDVARWRELFAVNRDQLVDPGALDVGMRLRLP